MIEFSVRARRPSAAAKLLAQEVKPMPGSLPKIPLARKPCLGCGQMTWCAYCDACAPPAPGHQPQLTETETMLDGIRASKRRNGAALPEYLRSEGAR